MERLVRPLARSLMICNSRAVRRGAVGAGGAATSSSSTRIRSGAASNLRKTWRAASLEWQTPQTPPVHGNWGPHLPVVYRWAYAYSVPGAPEDFIAQNAPPEAGGSEPEPHASRGAVA